MTGAHSAVGLRSMAARYLFLDEVDAYPSLADDEGDPVALAIAGTRTFAWRRKILIVSTPTVAGRSRIEREFLLTDRRRFHVPCPHCRHRQALRFVPVRAAETQAAGMLLSVSALLVRQRTKVANPLRGHAAEFGVVAAKGLGRIAVLLAAVEAAEMSPPAKQALALLAADPTRSTRNWRRSIAGSRRCTRPCRSAGFWPQCPA